MPENLQRLSSRMTPVSKFVLPTGVLVISANSIFIFTHGSRPGFGAIIWSAACAFLLWWSLPIKKVSLGEGRFLISNYLREISVPTAHLVEIHEDRWNRTPSITLYFDPPTELGRKIRIIPPVDFFSREHFDRVAKLVHGCIERRPLG